MNDKRIGVIDLGTNTFNLLIAEVIDGKIEVIHSEKHGVALGMGGLKEGVITKDAILRALKTMSHFSKMCDVHYVEDIRAFGTSAIRDAINGKDLIQLIHNETGITVKMISGEEEAKLIFEGVICSYVFTEPAMIVDVGGGSTELIFVSQGEIQELVSLNIGVSRIFQELNLSDPLTEKEVILIESWIEERASSFIVGKSCDVMVGASGCFETFYEMIYKSSFPNAIDAIELPMQKINDVLDWIIDSDQIQRDLHPHIIPIRRKMAPIAAVKIRWIIKKLGIKKLIVSPCSLKEGVLNTAF